MTRINLDHPSALHDKHLTGEIHEITRVFGLVRKAQARGINRYNFKEKVKPPVKFTMGTGHVKFFYDKLQFIAQRYHDLIDEATKRGYNYKRLSTKELMDGIHHSWYNDYCPDDEAIQISRQRVNERIKEILSK